MLIPAQLKRDELKTLFTERWYDPEYQYFWSGTSRTEWKVDDNCNWSYQFCSVDASDNVIGYISYGYDSVSKAAYNFGLIAFSKNNSIFLDDVIIAVYEIFYKFHLEHMDFYCFSDNPAARGYRAFIKRYGGREVGVLRKASALLDGLIHDNIIFECLKSDLKMKNGKTVLQMDYEKIMKKRGLLK